MGNTDKTLLFFNNGGEWLASVSTLLKPENLPSKFNAGGECSTLRKNLQDFVRRNEKKKNDNVESRNTERNKFEKKKNLRLRWQLNKMKQNVKKSERCLKVMTRRMNQK